MDILPQLLKFKWVLVRLAFRWLCYASLVVVLGGFLGAMLLSGLDLCPTFNEGGISCISPFYERLATWSMTVMLLTVFTGLPGLLAIAGAVQLIVRAVRWRRHRRLEPRA